MVRILERLGQGIQALGVRKQAQWAVVGALMNYILGVGGQLAQKRGLDRSDFLHTVATMWSQLDPDEYPFTRGVAEQMRNHDDRADFLAGIDLILNGIDASARRIAEKETGNLHSLTSCLTSTERSDTAEAQNGNFAEGRDPASES